MIFQPKIEGSVAIRSSAEQVFRAFRDRVAAGLLMGWQSRRSRYLIRDASPTRVRFTAADWWTAISVGLNDVELEHVSPSLIHYHVQYWRWAAFAVGLSAALGIIGVAFLMSVDLRAYIASHPASMIPGLSIDRNRQLAWLMVIFWGFAWPWIVIALHKRTLRGLMTRLIREADTGNKPQVDHR